jgi:hypothetical protein
VLHDTRPSTRLQPSAWYRHREIKRQFCHIVHGDFTPVLAKHSKSFSLVDAISVGVDRMQRNFEPRGPDATEFRADAQAGCTLAASGTDRRHGKDDHLPDVHRKRTGGSAASGASCARSVFPQYDEFKARTVWSLSNAFTSAFKDPDPIPQFGATAKLGGFLEARFKQSF